MRRRWYPRRWRWLDLRRHFCWKGAQSHTCILYCYTLTDTLQLHLVGPNRASIALIASLRLIEPYDREDCKVLCAPPFQRSHLTGRHVENSLFRCFNFLGKFTFTLISVFIGHNIESIHAIPRADPNLAQYSRDAGLIEAKKPNQKLTLACAQVSSHPMTAFSLVCTCNAGI